MSQGGGDGEEGGKAKVPSFLKTKQNKKLSNLTVFHSLSNICTINHSFNSSENKIYKI